MSYAERAHLPDLRASSAGTRAVIAHPMHPNAVPVLEKFGGDSSNFAARQLTPRIASNADLILTMTRAHRDTVLELAPHRLHRTFTLTEAARLVSECGARTVADLPGSRPSLSTDETFDIADPIGQGPEYFSVIGSRIAELLPPVLELCRRG